MQFDVFFSICQTEVAGYQPDERQMLRNFFEQVEAADALGYGTAWLAESHLSCEIQKHGPRPVIPHFKGEIGLNTDVLLMARHVFARTRRIHLGSAIRSILVNGGPIAHAEAVRSFMSLHALDPEETRRLHLGFAAGRFPFSTEPFGIVPRNAWEEACWPLVKGRIFLEATELFLRLLRGDVLASEDLPPQLVTSDDFQDNDIEWTRVLDAASDSRATILKPGQSWRGTQATTTSIALPPRWSFNRLAVVPRESHLELLDLLIGSHDPAAQILANRFMPCGVFNLSITPGSEIERTHERMVEHYYWSRQTTPPALHGQPRQTWSRAHMPRTVLIFLEADGVLSPSAQSARAHARAQDALKTYWSALEGTLDERRIAQAVDNALIGNPLDIAGQIRERFHPDDRLMLWFDFFNHDSAAVVRAMEAFSTQVVPALKA